MGLLGMSQIIKKINNLIMLQPTNPYRIFKDFKDIYNKFIKKIINFQLLVL